MRKRTLFSVVSVLSLVVLAMAPARTHSAFAASAPKTLTGTVPDVVTSHAAQQVGPVAKNAVVKFTVSLEMRRVDELIALLHALNDPTSPQYHQWLSLQDVNSLFNPTSDEQDAVTSWLTSNGLTVDHTYANHLMVDAHGTAAQVQSLLHVQLNSYRATIHGKQATFVSPDSNPVVDPAVSTAVATISGLDSVPRFHTGTNGTAHGSAPYYPQDFANAYDMNSLWAAGGTGAGQNIGITMWTVPPSDSTLQQWGSATGANAPTTANGRLHVIPVDGGTTDAASPDQGEAGMDIEYSSGMAPGATVNYYEAPTDSAGNPTDQGLLDALNQAGTDSHNNRVITSSWGGCEASSSSDPWTTSAEHIFASNGATGHNYFFSTGDNGSWCTTDPEVNYPASSPNVTAVGGTRFSAPIGSTWPGEAAWTYTGGSTPEGSGGGYSNIFSRPTWQTATGLAANGKRGIPDVSAVADPGTGAYVCYGSTPSCQYMWGGTSLASPLWAGILTSINSYLVAQSKAPAGFLDSALYKLNGTTQTYKPLHDVTSGTNGAYNAGTGWDAVTGLGTPDAWNLARDLAGSATTSSPTPTATTTGTTNYVSNGGFESGLTGWAPTTWPASSIVTSSPVHSGSSAAGLCGVLSCTDQLVQTLKLPSSFSSLTLSYWLNIVTNNTSIYCTETQTIQIKNAAGAIVYSGGTVCGHPLPWTQKSVTLSSQLTPYAGQNVQVVLRATTGTLHPTKFIVDDVALTSSTSTTAPSPTSTPTATATGTTQPTATSTPTATPTSTTAPTTTGGQLLGNGGFETGTAAPWTESSPSAGDIVSTDKPHTGSYSAWFCGYSACNDQMTQTVTLPTSVTSATLTYWFYSDTKNSTSYCYDHFYARIKNSTGALIAQPQSACNSSPTNGWVSETFNLTPIFTAYSGKQVQVTFQSTTAAGDTTDFFVDDVALTVNGGSTSGTATPTATTSATVTPTATKTATSTPTSTPSTSGTCPGSTSACQSAMLSILNSDRSAVGVAPLTLNLTQSNGTASCVGSYGHSTAMAATGTIWHTNPSYPSASFPTNICVAYSTAGENVGEASGNELSALQQLDSLMMGEPHDSSTCATTVNHACNIINPSFHQVGIGIYVDASGTTWLTEDFTN